VVLLIDPISFPVKPWGTIDIDSHPLWAGLADQAFYLNPDEANPGTSLKALVPAMLKTALRRQQQPLTHSFQRPNLAANLTDAALRRLLPARI
jgi:hypothetical protein